MEIVPRTDFGVDPLIEGRVDVLVGWIVNEGVAVQEAGVEPGFMLMSDYGIPDYATLIFTSEDMIKNRPDVVARVLKSIIAGWEDVVKDPQTSTEHVISYSDNLNEDQQLRRVQASMPLLQPARAKSA
ncbi:ABC transporter substrate-binding protein [bacterium]|nr:ABC transporter substrate-binding protein [bacterium]